MGIFKRLFTKTTKFKGRVLDIGLNDDGEFLVVLKITDGNPYHLKRHLENDDRLDFETSHVKINKEIKDDN